MQSVERAFLRPIKKEGSYDDTSQYLDVQFRLLKEDLVYPLREGIKELVASVNNKKHDLQVRVKQVLEYKPFYKYEQRKERTNFF